MKEWTEKRKRENFEEEKLLVEGSGLEGSGEVAEAADEVITTTSSTTTTTTTTTTQAPTTTVGSKGITQKANNNLG